MVVAIAAVLLAAWLFLHPFGARNAAREKEQPIVAVNAATRGDLDDDVWLTAEFRPYQNIALHSKVSGFLKEISVDVGDQVKEGDVIAKIEIPELQDDLEKAQSSLEAAMEEVNRCQADAEQTELVYKRLTGVSETHPKLVAQQEIDDARAKASSTKSALNAAKQRVAVAQSEVRREKTLLDYSQITVPFPGIVTKRYADPGALIQSGINSNTQAMPLVELAQQDVLRLVFPVPESAASLVRKGMPVEVRVPALDVRFRAEVSRYAGGVDHSTRTMHTEADIKNSDLRFAPGMYAYVRLITAQKKNVINVPVQALNVGENPSVYIVDSSGVIQRKPVKIGLQTPRRVEILEGINEGDYVVVGGHGSIRTGEHATPKVVALPETEPE